MSYEDEPQFNEDGLPKGYVPLFELGLAKQNPAIKVLGKPAVCPVTLASMVVGLFEAVMRDVSENNQNEFELTFKKAFRVLMKERHNCDIRFNVISPPDEQ